MENNMYHPGDYVYIETSPISPYQISRIEELNKTPSGNVEAKVRCFYRKRDISSSLIMLTDNHQNLDHVDETDTNNQHTAIVSPGETLTHLDKHQLCHRELYLSREVESLPATHIRGKCTVNLLHETETLFYYLNNEDTFFYSLVYDSEQNTLLADKKEIRVGSIYQADIPPLLIEGKSDNRILEELEELTWTPNHGLTDHQIDKFVVMSRTLGTFARSLNSPSSGVVKPSLHTSASTASRDVNVFHAMDTLHNHKYDISKAVCSLISSPEPVVLVKDQMEDWSESETRLFEEAMEKYGKHFNAIRHDFLPWKTMKNIIEYYYLWKTPDRNIQHRRIKAIEAEYKLKQVYIPNSSKSNPEVLSNGKSDDMLDDTGTIACESCACSTSSQWHAWWPSHTLCKLCNNCWDYWKKYGGLKIPSEIGREEEHSQQNGGNNLVQLCKSRAGIMLHTSVHSKIMRRLCQDLIQPRKACRNPTLPINTAIIKQESIVRMVGKSIEDLAYLIRGTGRRCGSFANVLIKLGRKEVACPQWMLPTKVILPKPISISYRKSKKSDVSVINTPVPAKVLDSMNNNIVYSKNDLRYYMGKDQIKK